MRILVIYSFSKFQVFNILLLLLAVVIMLYIGSLEFNTMYLITEEEMATHSSILA